MLSVHVNVGKQLIYMSGRLWCLNAVTVSA